MPLMLSLFRLNCAKVINAVIKIQGGKKPTTLHHLIFLKGNTFL